MPCIEISLPKVSQETKSALAHELTKAFCSSTGHPPDIFGLRFFEYEPGTAAVAGKVLDEQAPQEPPYLHMLVYCPRLRRSVKQKLGAELTRAFRSASGQESWAPIIHICEHPFDNVVVDGRLLTDTYEECAKRPYYYELPKD